MATGPSEAYTFHWADYLVFVVLLALNAAIGVFYAYKDRKHQTTEDFLMAGRSMTVFPVAVSMFASCMSAIAFAADPVEVYYYGVGYLVMVVGSCIGLIPVARFFVPHFYAMESISCFAFLEEVFHVNVRRVASLIQIIIVFSFMAMISYAPSVALAQASGINVWTGIFITTAVCTFFTSLGGMKAVVWANMAQMAIMVLGLFILAFKGISDAGGFTKVITMATEGQRVTYTAMTPDPFVRSSFWTYLFGGVFRSMIPLISMQFAIQRYGTLPNVTDAKRVLYVMIPLYGVMAVGFYLAGLVMYVSYADCDPLASGTIKAFDQLTPLIVMRVLGDLPGLPGLFVAAMFAASLSSLSSGQNGLAANFLSDFIQPWYKRKYGVDMPERGSFITAKVLAASVGLVIMALAFGVVEMGGSLFLLFNKIMGMFAGPTAALFTLAMFFRQVNVVAVMIGFGTSVAVTVWIGVGAQIWPPPAEVLPVSVTGCYDPTNATIWNSTTLVPSIGGFDPVWATAAVAPLVNAIGQPTAVIMEEETGFDLTYIYRLNPLLYMPLGYLLALVIPLAHLYGRRLCKSSEGKAKDEVEEEILPINNLEKPQPNLWTKEGATRLSMFPADFVMPRVDRGTQTYQSIPPYAEQDYIWILDKESVM